jgi:HAE1 family hydrophobic/amphiphilic exporter-1
MSANGLNTATVSAMIRNRVVGLTASQFRESGNEYDIVVRFDEEFRNSVTDIENIAIPTQNGVIRLVEMARVVEFWSPPNVDRKRRERIVTVSTTPYKVPMGEIAANIKKAIADLDIPSGVMVQVGGAYEDMAECCRRGLLLLVSLILVYIVMAAQFESLKMPLIIMVSIPFSFTGVILALLITQTTLSVIAALGAIMLVGIVVKNAIVLIDFTNLMRTGLCWMKPSPAGRPRLRRPMTTANHPCMLRCLSNGEGSGWKRWVYGHRVLHSRLQ